MLIASDGAHNDRFGNSVAMSGETIVIGAAFSQIGENVNQGSAYIFTPNGPPTITASPITIQQGRAVTGASIATVSDSETSASLLTVSVVPGGTAKGISLTNIANTAGSITADLAATCAATGGTLRLRVTDTGGLTGTVDLQLNVASNDPPVIICSANIVKPAEPAQCSAVVIFTVTATDDCDGTIVPNCTPPSGSTFNKGITTVTCTASDSSNHPASCSFTVTVTDTQKPTITCPANLTAVTTRPGDANTILNYAAPTATDNCTVHSIVCNPPSGSSFPLGTTTVACTATDTSGNMVQCSFIVTLFDVCLQDDSNANHVLLFISSGPQAGNYRFCCGDVVKTGSGVVTRQGNIFNLTHNSADRRVQASADSSFARGSAQLQSPPGSNLCQINDRNTRDNSCHCSN
jgi:hypothetical protein